MSKYDNIYDRSAAPLFDRLSPIDFDNIYQTVINSPVIEALATPIKTQLLQVINNPSLRYVKDIECLRNAVFANQHRRLLDFGIHSQNAFLAQDLGRGFIAQVIENSENVLTPTQVVSTSHPCVSNVFKIQGIAANLPKQVHLSTQIDRKDTESKIWNGEGYEPRTSLNSIPEDFRLKGLIFEYISLLTLSLKYNNDRMYRQFAPLTKINDEHYTQGFRVDGFINNIAIECKWDLIDELHWKVEKDKARFESQSTNFHAISYRPITGSKVKFQTYNDLATDLTASSKPVIGMLLQRFQKLLDLIESNNCLPPNADLLCGALYNILDQSSFLPSAEKIDFIVEHVHQLFNVHKYPHQLVSFIEDNEFNLPELSDESSFKFKSDVYIAYREPKREFADPETALKQLSVYRSVHNPDLNLSYVQELQPEPLIEIPTYYSGDSRHALVYNQGQANITQLNQIVRNINSQQASIAEIYTLFNFISTASHSSFTNTSHLHAVL